MINLIELGNVKQFIANQQDILLAYLYGSYVDNELREESDIDIAVLFANSLQPERIIEFKNELENFFNKEVDLGVLNDSSPIYRRQVLDKGKEIFCRNTHIKNLFILKTYNEYDDLKYYRRPAIDKLLKGLIFA